MLREKIAEILDLFVREELGNRLSRFSMMSLRGMIVSEIDKYLAEQEAKVEGEVKE